MAVEGRAAVLGSAQVVEDGQPAGIVAVDMRQPLAEVQRLRRLGDQREHAAGPGLRIGGQAEDIPQQRLEGFQQHPEIGARRRGAMAGIVVAGRSHGGKPRLNSRIDQRLRVKQQAVDHRHRLGLGAQPVDLERPRWIGGEAGHGQALATPARSLSSPAIRSAAGPVLASDSRSRLEQAPTLVTFFAPPRAASRPATSNGAGPDTIGAAAGALAAAMRISVATWSAIGPSTTCRSFSPGQIMPLEPSPLSRASLTAARSTTTSRSRVVQASIEVRLAAPPSASTKSAPRPPDTAAGCAAWAASSASSSRPGVLRLKRLIANRNTP